MDDSCRNLRIIRELYEAASALPPVDRPQFLEKACKDDRKLYEKVMALLLESETEPGMEDLWIESVWNALEAFKRNPARLKALLESPFFEDLIDEPSMLGKKISHFKILSVAGRGGMGIIYKAEDTALNRNVALKFLHLPLGVDPVAKDTFLREARTASALDHPNIATIHEIGETEDGRLFIAMGYYQGESLKERISRGPLLPEQAQQNGVQLTQALVHAHSHGILHRDIKPGNILLGDDGRLRLLDFGLASLAGQAGLDRNKANSGTALYMSPEQVEGMAIDERSDIWSIGVVLYEMLTGDHPFKGETLHAVFKAIQEKDPFKSNALKFPESTTAKKLKKIIAKCLAKDPGQRYPSSKKLLSDLQALEDRSFLMKLRNPLGWLSLAVAVVAGAITVHYLLSTDKSPKPGYAEIVADPVSSGQGNVLKVQPGEVGDILNRFSLVIPLPATAVIHSATLPAHPATFYLKVLRPSVKGQPGMVDIVWGLASDSVRGRKMEVSYRDASVIGRYDITGKMYIWDNYQYLPVTREPLDTDTWYELWYVIDHARNTYDLHIKGGSQFPLTTCAARGISYRMNTQEALDRLLIITTAGSRNTVEKGKDPSYFDSFYMYPQGANTSPPDNAWILIEDFENSSHRFEN